MVDIRAEMPRILDPIIAILHFPSENSRWRLQGNEILFSSCLSADRDYPAPDMLLIPPSGFAE
jgi:hypothetical protein